ncbi:AMP-binding enzyme, partial [Pseudonocardia pini]|uniref:AMP-binding enzyme n=1 Tax=Pseudonocardia pini TaxID=2758030 RepID=UPI00406BCA69
VPEAVEVEPGHAAPDIEELIALCRSELTPYEVPKHVLVVDELPRTPSTKVSRVELLDLVRARLAAEPTPA